MFKLLKNSQSGFAPIIIIVVLLLLVGGGIGGGVVYTNSQKAEVKKLSQEQSSSFSSLEDKYKKIVDTYKRSLKASPGKLSFSSSAYKRSSEGSLEKSTVLGVEAQKSNVLGLEDSDIVIMLRQLTELYRDSKKVNNTIKSANDSVKAKVNNPILKPMITKGNPTEDTTKFVTDTENLLTFMEKGTDIQLKAITVGFDLGVALEYAIQRGGDNESVNNLDKKIDELKDLAKEEAEIDINTVPQELRSDFEKSRKSSDEMIKKFEVVSDSIRNKDVFTLQSALQDIILASAVASEKGDVAIMSFWQKNETIRSVEDLKQDWDKYSKGL